MQMIKNFISLFLSPFFSTIGKIVKWIVIGLIFLGMLIGWPLKYFIDKWSTRNDDNYK